MAPSADHPVHNCSDGLSSETIHTLSASLTIIKAQGQMIARWMRRNDIAEAEAVLSRLTVIDDMVMRLCDELDGLHEASPAHHKSDQAADGS